MARSGHSRRVGKMTRSGEASGAAGPLHSTRPHDAAASFQRSEGMKTTRHNLTLFAAGAILLLGASGIAQTPTHTMSTVADTQWGPAPPMAPPGAQIAVLTGDPGKPVPYTVRLKFPANYAIPAHSHPGDENVVVTSGTLFM